MTPGYPIFLSAVFKISGGSVFAVQSVQSVLGALTALIAYLLMRRFFSRTAAFVALVLASFYPPFICGSISLLTECLFMFLVMLYFFFQFCMLFDHSASDRRKLLYGIIEGAFLALSILTRPAISVLAVIPLVYIISDVPHGRIKARMAFAEFGVFTASMIVVMLPWWIRNAVCFGEFIPLCTQGANAFLYGTYPDMVLTDGYIPRGEEGALAVRRIIDGFKNEPIEYLRWYTVGKMKRIFGSPWYYLPGGVQMPYLGNIVRPFHAAVIGLGAPSVIGCMTDRKLRFIALFAIFNTALQLLVVPEDRYAYASVYFMILAIAASVSMVIKRIRELLIKRKASGTESGNCGGGMRTNEKI